MSGLGENDLWFDWCANWWEVKQLIGVTLLVEEASKAETFKGRIWAGAEMSNSQNAGYVKLVLRIGRMNKLRCYEVCVKSDLNGRMAGAEPFRDWNVQWPKRTGADSYNSRNRFAHVRCHNNVIDYLLSIKHVIF